MLEVVYDEFGLRSGMVHHLTPDVSTTFLIGTSSVNMKDRESSHRNSHDGSFHLGQLLKPNNIREYFCT
jgi:hypothetical protein